MLRHFQRPLRCIRPAHLPPGRRTRRARRRPLSRLPEPANEGDHPLAGPLAPAGGRTQVRIRAPKALPMTAPPANAAARLPSKAVVSIVALAAASGPPTRQPRPSSVRFTTRNAQPPAIAHIQASLPAIVQSRIPKPSAAPQPPAMMAAPGVTDEKTLEDPNQEMDTIALNANPIPPATAICRPAAAFVSRDIDQPQTAPPTNMPATAERTVSANLMGSVGFPGSV